MMSMILRWATSLNQLAFTNNISVDLIKQVNNLSDATIFAGQKLLIPLQASLE